MSARRGELAGAYGGGARAIGEIIAGAKPTKARRTWQPVRRNSFNVGDREGRIWQPVNPREIGLRLRAAERYDEDRKLPGAHAGPLGLTGLRVLRELYRLVCYRTGRLDPCLLTIAARCRLSKDTVVRALARLREHGFVNWIRRTIPIEGEGPGPRVRQTSNAYGFGLPAAAAAFVRSILRARAAPPPDDDTHRRREEAGAARAMVDSLPLQEFVGAVVDDPTLNESLTALARAIEASASQSNSAQSGQK